MVWGRSGKLLRAVERGGHLTSRGFSLILRAGKSNIRLWFCLPSEPELTFNTLLCLNSQFLRKPAQAQPLRLTCAAIKSDCFMDAKVTRSTSLKRRRQREFGPELLRMQGPHNYMLWVFVF